MTEDMHAEREATLASLGEPGPACTDLAARTVLCTVVISTAGPTPTACAAARYKVQLRLGWVSEPRGWKPYVLCIGSDAARSGGAQWTAIWGRN